MLKSLMLLTQVTQVTMVLVLMLVVGCRAGSQADLDELAVQGETAQPCEPVLPGVLYRTSQPDFAELTQLHRELGIRTIVNARGAKPGRSWYQRERAFAAAHGIRLVDLDVSHWRGLTKQQREAFLDLIRDPGCYPILVHCKFGVVRTNHLVHAFEANRHLVRSPPQSGPAAP